MLLTDNNVEVIERTMNALYDAIFAVHDADTAIECADMIGRLYECVYGHGFAVVLDESNMCSYKIVERTR